MPRKMDPLESAIVEVNSVADELKILGDKVKQYNNASRKLSEIGNTLNELNNSINGIQYAFTAALDKTKLVTDDIEKGRTVVEKLVARVPNIVKRIEKADMTKAVNNFTDSMKVISGMIERHKKIIMEVENKYESVQNKQNGVLNEINKKIQKLVSNSYDTTVGIDELQKSSMMELGKVVNEVVGLRKEIEKSNNILKEQDVIIKTLSKKKGFFFK